MVISKREKVKKWLISDYQKEQFSSILSTPANLRAIKFTLNGLLFKNENIT